MVEYWYCTMALCKVGNLRDICSQGYETPVVHQTVHKLPVHTGAARLRSHCSCVQSMVFWEWYHEVVCFLLGNSPASEFYVPTFWNTLSVPCMKMEQTMCSETSAYKIQTPGSYPEESVQIQNIAEVWNQEMSWVAGSRCHHALCHVSHGWSQCECANLKYSR